MLSGLVSGFLRLTVSSANLPSTNVLQTTSRFLSTTSCLSRKLDNHAYPPYTLPSSKNKRWIEQKPFHELYEYTIKPLPFPKTGGRGPNGRIWNHRRGGGHKRNFRMIDWVRCREADGLTRTEKVEKILYDPNRSARIALVATGEMLRYVIATNSMKPGDLIQSSQVLTRSPIRPNEGDSHPLGSLPLGTLVSCVEQFPGAGGRMASAAGVSAQLVRKQDGLCVVRLPSKREVILQPTCSATVGRISNVDHNKRVIGKAGRNRWLGIRPRSGRWHRKDGYCGRKIRGIKPPVKYTKPRAPKLKRQFFGLPNAPGIYETRLFSR